jgi:hypothetical protein
MNDQELSGGAPAPDANASQAEQPANAEIAETGSEAGSSPAADPSEKPAKPAKTGEQLRIDELTRRLRETERRYERVLRIAESNRPSQPTPPQPAQEPRKTLKDFNFDEAAHARYLEERVSQVADKVVEAKLSERQKQLAAAERQAKFEAKERDFAKTVEDYDEVTEIGDPNAPNWVCSEPMAEVIEESDEGPALKYYLAQNPDEALKLYRMSPAQAGRAMALLETRLVNERAKAAEKTVSKAPPPAPTIDAKGDAGARVSTTSPESDAMSDAEWFKAEIARINRKKRRQA